jgi:hypothetical protein
MGGSGGDLVLKLGRGDGRRIKFYWQNWVDQFNDFSGRIKNASQSGNEKRLN